MKKILLIRNDKIGDLVMSSFVPKQIKKVFPESKITFVCSPENAQIIEKNKYINKIVILKSSPRKIKEIYSYIKLAESLKKEKFDIGLDLRGSFFNTLLMKLSRIRYKAGFYEQSLSKKLLNYPYKRDKKKHESVLLLDMLNKSLNLKLREYYPDIQTSINDKKELEEFLKKNKLRKFICVCPDASNKEKQWSIKKFDEIIKCIHRKYSQYKIILIGADKEKIEYLKKENQFCISLIKENLRKVYLLFKKAKLIISVEGGLAHIAATSKSKVIVLIPKSLPLEHIKPIGKNVDIILAKGDIAGISLDYVIKIVDKCLR